MGAFYRLIGLVGIALFLGLCALTYYTHPQLLPKRIVNTVDRILDKSKAVRERIKPEPPTAASPSPPIPRAVSANQVTLYLTNGGAVTGELVSESADGVTLRWDYGEVTFSRVDITRVEKGQQVETEDDIIFPPSVNILQ